MAELLKTLESIDVANIGAVRHQAYLAIRRLLNKLETPYETFLRRTFDEPAIDACLKIGVDLNLFEALAKDNGSAKTVDALAAETGADVVVLRRVCKHLAAMEAIRETEEDTYTPTEYSNSLLDPGLSAGVKIVIDGPMQAIRALPEWLKQNNYSNPTDPRNCPAQIAFATDKTFWEFNEESDERRHTFNMVMVGKESQWKSAMELYPAQERLIEGLRPGGLLMVDVAGGLGQDLKRFIEKYPNSGGKFILQDQATVLAEANLDGLPIEPMPHDFFTEQPVKAPRAFFMKQIIHDWPDHQAIPILANLKAAMEPGYTKLLIHDLVIPATNAIPYSTALDITMMSVLGAKERTQADWNYLIEAAGLKLENVYSDPGYFESIFELVRED